MPKTVVNMGGSDDNGNGGTVLDALLKLITLDKLGISISEDAAKASDAPETIAKPDVPASDLQTPVSAVADEIPTSPAT